MEPLLVHTESRCLYMHITHVAVYNFLHGGEEWLMERSRTIFCRAAYKQPCKKRLLAPLWACSRFNGQSKEWYSFQKQLWGSLCF